VTPSIGPLRCFVDVETTGLDVHRDGIIEVGWVCWQGNNEVERGGSLVRNHRPLPDAVAQLTGIEAAELRQAPPLAVVMAMIVDVMARCTQIGAYAAAFDRGFLEAAARRSRIPLPVRPWLDVLALARQQRPGLQRHRLIDVAAALGVQAEGPLHRATADASLCAHVWSSLRNHQHEDDHSARMRLFQ
jgi:DNA polymerase III epsilon subunit-like protein